MIYFNLKLHNWYQTWKQSGGFLIKTMCDIVERREKKLHVKSPLGHLPSNKNRPWRPKWKPLILQLYQMSPLLWDTGLNRKPWPYQEELCQWRASLWLLEALNCLVDPACWLLDFGELSSASAAWLWGCGTSWTSIKGEPLICWDWGLWYWPSVLWWWWVWQHFTS